jgi:hypothetical protein
VKCKEPANVAGDGDRPVGFGIDAHRSAREELQRLNLTACAVEADAHTAAAQAGGRRQRHGGCKVHGDHGVGGRTAGSKNVTPRLGRVRLVSGNPSEKPFDVADSPEILIGGAAGRKPKSGSDKGGELTPPASIITFP